MRSASAVILMPASKAVSPSAHPVLCEREQYAHNLVSMDVSRRALPPSLSSLLSEPSCVFLCPHFTDRFSGWNDDCDMTSIYAAFPAMLSHFVSACRVANLILLGRDLSLQKANPTVELATVMISLAETVERARWRDFVDVALKSIVPWFLARFEEGPDGIQHCVDETYPCADRIDASRLKVLPQMRLLRSCLIGDVARMIAALNVVGSMTMYPGTLKSGDPAPTDLSMWRILWVANIFLIACHKPYRGTLAVAQYSGLGEELGHTPGTIPAVDFAGFHRTLLAAAASDGSNAEQKDAWDSVTLKEVPAEDLFRAARHSMALIAIEIKHARLRRMDKEGGRLKQVSIPRPVCWHVAMVDGSCDQVVNIAKSLDRPLVEFRTTPGMPKKGVVLVGRPAPHLSEYATIVRLPGVGAVQRRHYVLNPATFRTLLGVL